MSVVAHLGALGDAETRYVLVARPPEVRAAVAEAEADGWALVELDLPIGRLALPRRAVERAVLATVVRGRPRELVFVRGRAGGVVKVRDTAALDLAITLRDPLTTATSPLVATAMEVLAEAAAPMHGKELLRAVRARRSAGAHDAALLGKALVRRWNDGLLDLALR